MKIVNTFEITNLDGTTTEQVVIELGNYALETMSRAEYDRRKAEQSTPLGVE
jgi:hypothetical protein